jgi:type IV pilus assembly protein PilC
MPIFEVRKGARKPFQRGEASPAKGKEPLHLSKSKFFSRSGGGTESIAVFVRQLATMINAGLPIIQSLDVLQDQQENAKLAGMIAGLKESVQGGLPLSEAFGKFPESFNTLFTQMVAAGETGGILDAILLRLADHMEKVRAIRSKVKGALIYPLVTLSVAALVLMVILVFVIPVFEDMFAQFGAELPMPTQMVVNLSGMVKNNLFLIVMITLVSALLLLRWYRTPKGRFVVDGFLLKLPIVGGLITKPIVARVTRTIGSLIASGVTLPEALRVTAKTSGNRVMSREVDRICASVVEGKTLEQSMGEMGILPAMVRRMAGVGESTGTLDLMFEKTAQFYEDELDRRVDAVTDLVEPLLMIVLGVVVGVLMVSMYLPMFNMATAVGG